MAHNRYLGDRNNVRRYQFHHWFSVRSRIYLRGNHPGEAHQMIRAERQRQDRLLSEMKRIKRERLERLVRAEAMRRRYRRDSDGGKL